MRSSRSRPSAALCSAAARRGPAGRSAAAHGRRRRRCYLRFRGRRRHGACRGRVGAGVAEQGAGRRDAWRGGEMWRGRSLTRAGRGQQRRLWECPLQKRSDGGALRHQLAVNDGGRQRPCAPAGTRLWPCFRPPPSGLRLPGSGFRRPAPGFRLPASRLRLMAPLPASGFQLPSGCCLLALSFLPPPHQDQYTEDTEDHIQRVSHRTTCTEVDEWTSPMNGFGGKGDRQRAWIGTRERTG